MNPLQFQVPTSPDSAPQVQPEVVSAYNPDDYNAALIDDLESAFAKAEREPQAGRYAPIKAIEKDIPRLHEGATEENLPKPSIVDRARQGVMYVVLKLKPPMSLEDKLVEAESKIGGELLPAIPGVTLQRFWFHSGDWFYEVHDSKGQMVARYQFDDDFSYKLVDGKEVEFAEGEEARLVELAGLYYEQIKLQLYPNKSDYTPAA